MNAPNNLAEPLVGRDLSAARKAYEQGPNSDAAIEASRAAHSVNMMNGGANGMAFEEHEASGGRLKAVIFGGLDGILTSFAIISGCVGAKLAPVAVLALGVSNVLADALSMGAGEFLSSRAYNAYVMKERDREAWELQNFPAGEIAEMVELFVARGMSREDAQFVIQRMAKYKDFFVDLMMTEELNLPLPSPEGSLDAFKDGLTMFAAFATFGLLPVCGFVAAGALYPDLDTHDLFTIACVITGICLIGLGAIKAKFHDKAYIRSAVETLLLGGACAAVAFYVGKALSAFATLDELVVLVTPSQPQLTMEQERL